MKRKSASVQKPRRPPKEPKLFEGENHGVLWVPGKGFERANFMGPGTNILARIKRGDRGKTAIDKISHLHDIDYTLASGTARTDAEQIRLAREADERMIRSGWKAFKDGKENAFNLVEGAGLIKAKNLLEDWKILSPKKFLSPRSFKYGVGANTRDATEYEILLRERNRLTSDGVTDDSEEQEARGPVI